MKSLAVLATAGIALAAYSLTASSSAGLPAGWTLGGEAPKLYEATTDPSDSPTHTASTVLRRTETSHPYGSAQMYTTMPVKYYAGKRVRVRMHVRFEGVAKYDGKIYIGAGNSTHEQGEDFGSGWTWYQCYLTLAASTSKLDVGVSLKGPGTAKVDAIQLQTVGDAPPDLQGSRIDDAKVLGDILAPDGTDK